MTDPIDETQPTPQAETPPEQTPPAPSAPAVDVQALQAAYTQSRQQISSWASVLGVSKDATPDQVSARLAALRETPAEPVDPRIAEQERKLRERERASLTRIYGQDAVDAFALAEEIGTLNDPEEIVTRFISARGRAAQAATPAAPVPPTAPAQQPATTPEPDLEATIPAVRTHSGLAPQYSAAEMDAMRESQNGPGDFIRGILTGKRPAPKRT